MAYATCATWVAVVCVAGDAKPQDPGGSGGKKDPFQRTFKDGKEAQEAMRKREPSAPKAGQEAPDFELGSPDGKKKVKLSSFKEKAPVVLIFGSYT